MAVRRKQRRTMIKAAESAELWDLWTKGEALGRGDAGIAAHIRPTGGIRPPVRESSTRALTPAEREEISMGLVEGQSLRAVTRSPGRAGSTISREIARNGRSLGLVGQTAHLL